MVAAVSGIHAQLLTSAQLSLWARVEGLTPRGVETALWEERRLVRTWAMRGTLHLLPSRELGLWVGALRGRSEVELPPSWFRHHGVTPDEREAILRLVPAVLQGMQLTRKELAQALVGELSPQVEEHLLSGWGALLKPAAYRGDLCYGPSRGQSVTFVRPADWLGAWDPVDEETARKEITRRYLHAYGPARRGDLARWWGERATTAGRMIEGLGDAVSEVEMEGWRGWALAEDLAEMETIEPSASVCLLPHFDPYVLNFTPRHELVPEALAARVFRPQAWISPVLLVDGRVAGVWDQNRLHSQGQLRLELFESLSRQHEALLEAEVGRLSDFLGRPCRLKLRSLRAG